MVCLFTFHRDFVADGIPHLLDLFLALSPGGGNVVPVKHRLVAAEVLGPLHTADLLGGFDTIPAKAVMDGKRRGRIIAARFCEQRRPFGIRLHIYECTLL